MITLPAEIVELIIKKLEWKDIRSCSTVNRQFYSVSLIYLYEEVYFESEDSLDSFIYSLTYYPQCQKAGIYVRKLAIANSYSDNEYFFEYYSITDTIDLLMHLPNIEDLCMESSFELIQALVDTKKPILTKLKRFDFDDVCQDSSLYADFCRKYRSSLTTIKSRFIAMSDDHLKQFLTLFPCLNSFEYYPKYHQDNTVILSDILEICPKLTDLTYDSESVETDTIDLSNIPRHPLTSLTLRLYHMKSVSIQFVRDCLPDLECLDLEMWSDQENSSEIIETILQLKPMKRIYIRFSGMLDKDLITRLIDHSCKLAEEKNESVEHKVILDGNYGHAGPFTMLEYKRGSSINTRQYSLYNWKNVLQVEQVLDQVGKKLEEFGTTQQSYCNVTWDLEDINRRCPMLSRLSLFHLNPITPHKLLTVNEHLTWLFIGSVEAKCLLSNQINVCYPMLKKLILSCIWLDDDDDCNGIYYIELPVTSIEFIHFRYLGCKWEIVVVKPMDGVSIKSWRYCDKVKEMVMSEEPLTIINIKRYKDGPLCVFICSEIEDVSIR
ncbi:hypothetical protein BDB01DRAFT_348916 [Pilobolus umbonatus]|nr:hypothetical protein BDB01DRAFT_348916 [Pilobolus umbonatus]